MDLPARAADAEFADLVYADPQWLRDEFDALIAASFGRPPTALPPAPPGAADRGPWHHAPGPGRGQLAASTVLLPRGRGLRRQRSPPA